MGTRVILVAVILSATTRGVAGQAGTADGVAALARGDYQRAVQILKPIAEDWRTDDTAAQFFMAGLYQTGRGVPADPLRACALYARAALNNDNPFGREAFALFSASIARGMEFDQECQLLASIGFDHGFEAVTFELGPGHFVEWTLAAATVTYDGRVSRAEMGFALPGARFLPLRHTELATGSTHSFRRHFIEVFVWEPARSGEWDLAWRLFEVVRDEIIPIETPGSVGTAHGDAPPSREAFDVREYAVLRVDEAGNPEWAVLKGPRPETQRIESAAERQEVREAALARAAALKRVDWNRRYDVYRQPAMTYIAAEGCGHVQVYGWTADRSETVVVRTASPDLGLSTRSATFDLSRESVNISVEAHVFDAPQRRFNFCSDVVMPPAPDSVGPEIWRAVAGTVTIELSPPGIRSRAPHLRRATVTLTDVVLRNAAGTTAKLPRPVTLIAIVGAIFG